MNVHSAVGSAAEVLKNQLVLIQKLEIESSPKMAKVAHLYEQTETAGKREAILGSALELFTERGFHGTAMPLVAEKAGVGAGTIYRYFESKEALVNALYQQWKEWQISSILRDVPAETPLREQFHIYWNRLAEFSRQHPIAFAFLELHFHAPYLDDRSRALEERGHNALVMFFRQCQQQQIVKEAPAEMLGSMVWGAFVGMTKACHAGCLELTQAMLDLAENCCWEAIRR